MLSSPFTNLVALLWTHSSTSMYFVKWGVQKWNSIQRLVSPVPNTGEWSPALVLLYTLFLTQIRMPLSSWTPGHTHWIILSQLSASTPKSLSAEQVLSHSSPSLCHYMGVVCPKCRTWHFVWLNLPQLSSVHGPDLSRSLCSAFLFSCRSTLAPNLVWSANLLRVHSIPKSKSSVKMLNRTKAEPWGTPPLSGPSHPTTFLLIKKRGSRQGMEDLLCVCSLAPNPCFSDRKPQKIKQNLYRTYFTTFCTCKGLWNRRIKEFLLFPVHFRLKPEVAAVTVVQGRVPYQRAAAIQPPWYGTMAAEEVYTKLHVALQMNACFHHLPEPLAADHQDISPICNDAQDLQRTFPATIPTYETYCDELAHLFLSRRQAQIIKTAPYSQFSEENEATLKLELWGLLLRRSE